MRATLLCVAFLRCAGLSASDAPMEVIVQSPDGPIVTQATTVEATPQTINVVSGDDLKRFRTLADSGPAFVRAYVERIEEPTLKDYDRAFHSWQTAASPKHSPSEVVDVLGAMLGEKLVADFQMEWVVVVDEYGTAFAVRHPQSGAIAYPFSSVQKRVDAGTYSFLYNIYYTLRDRLNPEKTEDAKEG